MRALFASGLFSGVRSREVVQACSPARRRPDGTRRRCPRPVPAARDPDGPPSSPDTRSVPGADTFYRAGTDAPRPRRKACGGRGRDRGRSRRRRQPERGPHLDRLDQLQPRQRSSGDHRHPRRRPAQCPLGRGRSGRQCQPARRFQCDHPRRRPPVQPVQRTQPGPAGPAASGRPVCPRRGDDQPFRRLQPRRLRRGHQSDLQAPHGPGRQHHDRLASRQRR